MNSTPSRWRRHVAAVSLVAAGVAGGGIAASTVAANAADSTGSTDSSSASVNDNSTQQQSDPSRSQRSDEQLLTGDTADKVRAAALAKYPGATVQRVETDSDGVYEAHLVTSDGNRVTVEVDKSFAVTGTEAGGPGGRGHGPRAGNGQPQGSTSGSTSSSTGA